MTALSRLADGVVYAYDRSDPGDPRIVASFPVPGKIDDHTVSTDLRHCVYAAGDEVACVDGSGGISWRLGLGAPGPEAGLAVTACEFGLDDDTVWVYVPDVLAER